MKKKLLLAQAPEPSGAEFAQADDDAVDDNDATATGDRNREPARDGYHERRTAARNRRGVFSGTRLRGVSPGLRPAVGTEDSAA